MSKKTVIPVLLAAMMIFSLAGCSAHEDAVSYGNVQEHEQQAEEEDAREATDKDLYTPMENTYGYKLKNYENLKSKMVLRIPSSYEVNWESDRHIVLLTPEDDPYFKDTTISIFYNWQPGDIYSISELDGIFSDDLYLEKFRTEGVTVEQYDKTIAKVTTGAPFTKEGYEEGVCSAVHDGKIKINGKMTDGYSRVDVYARWYDSNICLSAFCKSENIEKTRDLLFFLLSNVTYKEGKVGQIINSEEIGGIKIAVPKAFVQTAAGTTEGVTQAISFVAPEDTHTALSGMSISAYLMDNKTADAFLEDEENADMAGRYFLRNMSPSADGFNNLYYFKEAGTETIAGKTATRYQGTESIIPASENSDKYYTIGDTWYLEILRIKTGGQSVVIVYRYPLHELETAEKVYTIIVRDSK